ncbi:hypothetical protein FJZ36_09360 [Candidatus Poribacteria bacterium]|nr:hypothetical protein [Candidatus Poribacteria bacterium]
MKGIQYVVDDTGTRTAVVIDLREWAELWEDIEDVLTARERMKEPDILWEDFEAELDAEEARRGASAPD